MPKARRNKLVSLTQTDKKTKEGKATLIANIRQALDEYDSVYVFSVGDMRNSHLKEVRNDWKDTGRMFFGRNKVMAIALGTSEENEERKGLSGLASKLQGPVGLFCTSSPFADVQTYFQAFRRSDFARTGNFATETVTLHQGPVMNKDGEQMPHSLEPSLRKLGLNTSLLKGIPTLNTDQEVCKKGKKLNSDQAQILKLLGYRMSTFTITLLAHWTEETVHQLVDDEQLAQLTSASAQDISDDDVLDLDDENMAELNDAELLEATI